MPQVEICYSRRLGIILIEITCRYDSPTVLNFRRRHHHRQCRRIFTGISVEGTLVSGWCRSMGRSELHRRYYDQKRVGSYGGVAALQRVVSAERDVKRWLSKQDAYTLHKPVRRHFKRRCVVVGGPNQQWQADLVDMSRLKQTNDGTTFLLTVIDVFSKRAWCVPLKSKSAASLVTAFRQLLSNGNNRAPTTMQTDKGSEFLNRPLQRLLKECGVHHFTTHNEDTKASIVERFNRTLKLHQLPVIGFNSGHYDLNAIKKFFVPLLIRNSAAERASCFVIKRQNNFMCLTTDKFKFVDICNYLAPGFSYAKYLTAYGCAQQKGHFPYEYMNDLCKLEDRALPPQSAFFSRLTSEGISDTDYAACQAVWRDNRMTTLREYLVWYNNRDVTPFLEAIDKQFTFYRHRDIDMFKDGISVPGLSLLYMFNDLSPDTNFVTFNQTNSDLHQLVKDNIVGGPAIIFHRYHEKDVTKIRGGETCRTVVGYDANALYLWALMQDMPCGWYTRRREERQFHPQQAQPYGQMAVQWLTRESERTGFSIRHQANGREKRIGNLPVDGWCAQTRTAYQFHGCFWHGCPKCHADPEETNPKNGKTMAMLLADTKKHTAYLRRHVKVIEMWECQWKRERDPPPRQKWTMTQQQIIAAVVDGTLFGMIECDIRVPSELHAHFAEMQPIFKNATVTRDDIGPFMREYAEENDIMSTPRRMLVGSYHGKKILLSTPLLQWYLAHGLVVDRVYQIVEYERKPCFRQFGESVSAARRDGDADPDKAIIADTMKLLGNSAYGKTVTNVDRHRNVRYCTEVGTSLLINNKRFRQLDVVTDDAYEVTASKARLTYDLPLHIGFFVYQYAKLRMLQFYYDFVDRYVVGVNNHFVHNRFVIVMHSTSHSSKSIVLIECAVSIVGTSSGPSFNTARWIPIQRTSHWRVKPSTISSLRNTANTTSGTGPNGSRLNAVMITRQNTSRLVSSDSRGQPPRRVASRARRTTRGRLVYLRLSGAVMGSSGYVVRPITASVRQISAPRKG